MTDENGNAVPMRHWAKAEAQKTVFRMVLSALITAGIGWMATTFIQPVGWWVTGMASLPGRVEQLETSVRHLQRPDEVFQVSFSNTRAVDGYCVEGQPCTINLRLRRLKDAQKCRVEPATVQWGFINPRSDVFISAERLDRPNGRNIGVVWEDVQIRIRTPEGLHPRANFTFIARYTDCPGWAEGEEPFAYQTDPIPFEIRGTE